MQFLIVGAGRGGTSLLMGLLDGNTDLEVGYELYSIDCLMGFGLKDAAKLHRTNMMDHRIDTFKARCNHEASQHPDKQWGNKITTEQLYGLHDHNVVNGSNIDEIHTFFQKHFPSLKVIFIMRDGRTCVRSKLGRTSQDLPHAISRWKYAVKVCRQLQDQHAAIHVVKYEDILREPQNALAQICAFLEIDYQSDMLEGVSNEKMLSEYRSASIDRSKLSLKDVPPMAIPMLLDDLRILDYISGRQYWFQRIRYNRWFGLAALSTTAIFAVAMAMFALK